MPIPNKGALKARFPSRSMGQPQNVKTKTGSIYSQSKLDTGRRTNSKWIFTLTSRFQGIYQPAAQFFHNLLERLKLPHGKIMCLTASFNAVPKAMN